MTAPRRGRGSRQGDEQPPPVPQDTPNRPAPSEGVAWFAGLTCDHLFADCPSRLRAEAALRRCGWWDVGSPAGWRVDPHGRYVCGLCRRRWDAAARRAA